MEMEGGGSAVAGDSVRAGSSEGGLREGGASKEGKDINHRLELAERRKKEEGAKREGRCCCSQTTSVAGFGDTSEASEKENPERELEREPRE